MSTSSSRLIARRNYRHSRERHVADGLQARGMRVRITGMKKKHVLSSNENENAKTYNLKGRITYRSVNNQDTHNIKKRRRRSTEITKHKQSRQV